MLYLSLTLPPAAMVLVELTMVLGTPGVKCCIKTPTPAVADCVMNALEKLM